MLRMMRYALCTAVSLILLTHVALAVTQLRLARLAPRNAQELRLVFELSAQPQYKSFHLSSPPRLVVDLIGTQLKTQVKNLSASGFVKRVRSHQYRKKLRLVFDLNAKAKSKVFLLARSKQQPARLVVDLKNQTLRASARAEWQKATPVTRASLPLKTELRKVVIGLDPGHGGKDPGATGPKGAHEKTVVLAIAKRLQRLINKTPGMRAVLTRNGDYYIPLRQRLRMARKYKADMFISIHADAYRNHRARGASVFALSARGASSEAARWLAEKENRSELLGGVELQDKSNMLRSVLIDLSQTGTIRASLTVGADILRSLKGITRLHHDRVEQAGFVVLKSPDIPSVLVETGFLSNPKEERALRQSRYQQKLAGALMNGIRRYFAGHAPLGTWLAWQHRATPYEVMRGDSLSLIAARYEVSLKRLKRFNNLKNSTLRVGQVLHIPPAS